LEFNYIKDVLSLILASAISNGWDPMHVPMDLVLQELRTFDVPINVGRHILSQFSASIHSEPKGITSCGECEELKFDQALTVQYL
jgi:hypothetical protein